MAEKEHLCVLVFPRNPNHTVVIIQVPVADELMVTNLFTSSGRNDRYIRLKDMDETIFLVNLDTSGTPEIQRHEKGECPFDDNFAENQRIARLMRYGPEDEEEED